MYAAVKGYIDDIEVADVRRFESEFLTFIESNKPEILQSITDTKDLTSDNENALKAAIDQFKKGFAASV